MFSKNIYYDMKNTMFMAIDAHIHTDWEDKMMKSAAKNAGINFSPKGLLAEMRESKVNSALTITFCSDGNNLSRIKKTPWFRESFDDKIKVVASINPFNVSKSSLTEFKSLASSNKIRGVKIYLGYFHLPANDRSYLPFYDFAAEHKLPVIFHTGDTFSSKGKLKYAGALQIDELAVDFPDTDFVIAHMANPWLMDAAAVIYKNKNVFGDLSGFAVGSLKGTKIDVEGINKSLEYCNYERVYYGSDWPIVKMKEYLGFMKNIIPKKHHEKVFESTAKKLFKF